VEVAAAAAAARGRGSPRVDATCTMAAAALANPVGGVVLGRPQPPPLQDKETVVLSHVLSEAGAYPRPHFSST